jgi:hypothetical protein
MWTCPMHPRLFGAPRGRARSAGWRSSRAPQRTRATTRTPTCATCAGGSGLPWRSPSDSRDGSERPCCRLTLSVSSCLCGPESSPSCCWPPPSASRHRMAGAGGSRAETAASCGWATRAAPRPAERCAPARIYPAVCQQERCSGPEVCPTTQVAILNCAELELRSPHGLPHLAADFEPCMRR